MDADVFGHDQMEVANCIFGEGRRFVPFMFYNNRKIGSMLELVKLQKEGRLVSRSKGASGDASTKSECDVS